MCSPSPKMFCLAAGPKQWGKWLWTKTSETLSLNVFPPFKFIISGILSQWQKADQHSSHCFPLWLPDLYACFGLSGNQLEGKNEGIKYLGLLLVRMLVYLSIQMLEQLPKHDFMNSLSRNSASYWKFQVEILSSNVAIALVIKIYIVPCYMDDWFSNKCNAVECTQWNYIKIF